MCTEEGRIELCPLKRYTTLLCYFFPWTFRFNGPLLLSVKQLHIQEETDIQAGGEGRAWNRHSKTSGLKWPCPWPVVSAWEESFHTWRLGEMYSPLSESRSTWHVEVLHCIKYRSNLKTVPSKNDHDSIYPILLWSMVLSSLKYYEEELTRT